MTVRVWRDSIRGGPNVALAYHLLTLVASGIMAKVSKGLRQIDFIVFHKGLMKVVDVDEVFKVIVVGLPHFACFDEFEDNLPEIFRGVDSPVSEDGNCHQAEVLTGEVADAFQEFASTDVPGVVIAAVPTKILLSMSQGSENKLVRVCVIGSRPSSLAGSLHPANLIRLCGTNSSTVCMLQRPSRGQKPLFCILICFGISPAFTAAISARNDCDDIGSIGHYSSTVFKAD